MDRVKARLDLASRALASLREALSMEPSCIVRDAAIQRFEFTFEAVWKAAKAFLNAMEGLDVSTPKAVIRASHQAGLLTEEETARGLAMADDRNLTSHTYDELLAVALYQRLPLHAALMDAWISRMVDGLDPKPRHN